MNAGEKTRFWSLERATLKNTEQKVCWKPCWQIGFPACMLPAHCLPICRIIYREINDSPEKAIEVVGSDKLLENSSLTNLLPEQKAYMECKYH